MYLDPNKSFRDPEKREPKSFRSNLKFLTLVDCDPDPILRSESYLDPSNIGCDILNKSHFNLLTKYMSSMEFSELLLIILTPLMSHLPLSPRVIVAIACFLRS